MRKPLLKNKIADISVKLERLVGSLDDEQLLVLTVERIREYRRLLQSAEHAHQKWAQAKSGAGIEQGQLKKLERVYLDALKRHQAQMTVVASLTDRLGYIPAVDQDGLTDEE